jgi:hypothetical protein
MKHHRAESTVYGAGPYAPQARHLNQIELARRWSLSPRTLERWRWQRVGPGYLKIGGRVVYPLEAVQAYESAQTRGPESTTQQPDSSRPL